MSGIPPNDPLYLHEIEFVRKFEAARHRVRWIPRAESRISTNDFVWLTGSGEVSELKCVKDKYSSIQERIRSAVIKARQHNVTKDVFVIDIGIRKLSPRLRNQLSKYNVRAERGTIRQLYVMSANGAQFERIDLLAQQ